MRRVCSSGWTRLSSSTGSCQIIEGYMRQGRYGRDQLLAFLRAPDAEFFDERVLSEVRGFARVISLNIALC